MATWFTVYMTNTQNITQDLTTYTTPCIVLNMTSGPVTLFWSETASRYLGTKEGK